ncbi:MAG TPA: adenylate/guanylate cyclase domain-containing protein [Stellaceae bacterium]|nr:adenylate/guanylate cyclase domain-containing protein [Stellaceae bacterium]
MHGERVERKLAAILAADVAGYSRLMGADEEGTLARLKEIRRELGDPKIAEHRGRIVKTTGDGLLVEFPSVVDAVRCAIEWQHGMTDRNSGVPAARRIDFRIGINVGDVIIDGDDIYGDGVNIAARLEGLADPGGVCVSARVYEDISGKIETGFEDIGERALKNIKRRVRVYRMRRAARPGATMPAPRDGLRQALGAVFRSMTRNRGGSRGDVSEAAPARASHRASEAAGKPAILVLPFRNATGDPEQEYFTDAVTADLTVDLSRMRDITVISAASALTYKGKDIDMRRLARELRVRYLVLGTIARIRELVRTNVQLVEAATGEQLWGDRFENEFADLPRLENAITGRIAASLNVQLMRAEGRRVEKSTHPDALDLRLRATSLFHGSVAPENTLAARQLLQRSLSLDPSSAEAWARLAEITISDHLNRWNDTGREQVVAAEEAARKSLSIDPNNALAYVANGLIHRAREEHQSAIESFSRAIELDPNFALAHAHKGAQLMLVGRAAETPAYVEQALRLSPHDPSVGIFYWILGRSYFFAERYGEAVPWLLKSVQARPNLWYNRAYLASAYALAGKPEDGARALAELNRRFSDPIFTLAIVTRYENESTPSSGPVVVGAREKFHEGLLHAGMAEE